MTETLIKVEGVSKKFCKSLKKSLWYGIQDLGREILAKGEGEEEYLRPDEFWAVNDVSFELKRGDCLGVIGSNGAGKTTLLRMLSGLIKPDRGRIEMRGRVGALIALGAGFNPLLTGRENIYVNAAILGLTQRAVQDKLEEIIDFAEIDQFIDMPVQNYSSGMVVRLGFSIASTLQPDILILDEVFAVGDQRFRSKCLRKIDALRERTATVFVSHDHGQIKHICKYGILMRNGCSVGMKPVLEVLNDYSDRNSKASANKYMYFDPIYINDPKIEVKYNEINGARKIGVTIINFSKTIIKIAEIRIVLTQNETIIHSLIAEPLDYRVKPNETLELVGQFRDVVRGKYQVNLFISRLTDVGTTSSIFHALNVAELAISGGNFIGYGCSHVGELDVLIV